MLIKDKIFFGTIFAWIILGTIDVFFIRLVDPILISISMTIFLGIVILLSNFNKKFNHWINSESKKKERYIHYE